MNEEEGELVGEDDELDVVQEPLEAQAEEVRETQPPREIRGEAENEPDQEEEILPEEVRGEIGKSEDRGGEEGDQKTEGRKSSVRPASFRDTEPQTDEEEDEEDRGNLEEDINVTDSQIMIQLKEAEEEAACLREEIACLRGEICDYQCRPNLSEEDRDHLREIQVLLMEKVAQLDELTKRIAKLMEFAGRYSKEEETTILDEEEEEKFPDDLLPRVVICSSWDDMMPKVVVCMDMKKPGAAKKEGTDRDENGLTPEQREALEQERRCMAEERSRLQYQIACMEGEMRVMVRENDMLSRKVAQLKSEIENQPPFEFEMSVSATQQPGVGYPKPGNAEIGYGIMGPNSNNIYTMGAALSPGAEVQGKLAVGSGGGGAGNQRYPPNYNPGPGGPPIPPLPQNYNRQMSAQRQHGQLPCGGATGIPGKSVPCPRMNYQEQGMASTNAISNANPNDPMSGLPPYGKKCRKDFNASQNRQAYDPNYGGGYSGYGGGGGCCNGGGGPGCNGCGGAGGGGGGGYMMPTPTDQGFAISPALMKQPPMDVNFKVNVQPQSCDKPCDKLQSIDADARSNKIAQQLQEIELELKRMQRDLCKAKKDKDTLKAQQATLNCAKNFLA